MSRPSLPITEAEARRPDPAVEAVALALVKAMAEASIYEESIDITIVLILWWSGVRWGCISVSQQWFCLQCSP